MAGTRLAIRCARIWLCCLLSVSGLLAQQPSGEFTLEEAITLALANNAQVLQGRESVLASAAKVDESRSALLPQLTAQASYARVGPIAKFTVAMGPLAPPITMKFGVENMYNVGVNIQHSLFNFGRTQATIDMNELGTRLSESGLELTRQAVAYQVIQIFYGMLLSTEAIDVLRQSVASLESRLTSTKARFDAGLASNFDLLTIEVQIATVRSRLVETETNLRKLQLLFNKLSGRDLEAACNPKGTLRYEPVEPNVESLIRTAQANRRELDQMRYQESLALAQIDLTNSLDKPNLNLNLSWGLRNGFMPNLEVLRGNWNAAVVMAYPLFDGFRTKSQLDQGEINLQLARMRSEDLRNAIALEVRQAVADLRMNEEKIRIEEVRVRQSEEAMRIAEERHGKGLLSTVDLLDSQSALETARLNVLQSVYAAILGKHNLDRAIGVAPY